MSKFEELKSNYKNRFKTNKVYQGDCLLEMQNFASNSIDAIITDPPYGISFMCNKWDYDVPSQDIWEECLRVLKPGGHLLSFSGTKTQHRMAVRIEDAGFEIRDMLIWLYGSGFPKGVNLGKSIDKILDDKGEWEGSASCLKPALEPITLARKPLLYHTITENIVRWGTGALNIDDVRFGDVDNVKIDNSKQKRREHASSYYLNPKDTWIPNDLGRYPSNVMHDESDEVLSIFPNIEISRYFYSTKSVKSERNLGLDSILSNKHPTVKPLKLMEHLVKMISKKGDTVLDPFAGSGSTGIACLFTNRNYVLIEKNPEYCTLIRERLHNLEFQQNK
jgi:site-specific DNA-methyltransferase (adenine-specific)